MPKMKRESRQFIVIDEDKLITEVQNRPILYDKALKGYRKPAIREGAWLEVATSLQNSVDECKKRWRSLRDAFMKQYKQYQRGDQSIKKKWLFYDKMEFLAPFFENINGIKFDLEDEFIEQVGELENGTEVHTQQNPNQGQGQQHATINKITVTSRPSIVCIPQQTEYQQHQIDLEYEEEMEQLEEEEETETMMTKQLIAKKEVIQPVDSQIYSHVYTTATTSSDDPLHHHTALHGKNLQAYKTNVIGNSNNNSNDPDEQFLLSFLPTFRRLSNKQSALAKSKITQLMFDVEFCTDNSSS